MAPSITHCYRPRCTRDICCWPIADRHRNASFPLSGVTLTLALPRLNFAFDHDAIVERTEFHAVLLGFCDYFWIGSRNERVLAAVHISPGLWDTRASARDVSLQLEFIRGGTLVAIASTLKRIKRAMSAFGRFCCKVFLG